MSQADRPSNAPQAHSEMIAPQPPPQAVDGVSCWELVIKDMAERDSFGRAKYGHPLRAFNGRKPLIDAYQEVLDLAVYLRQEIEERRCIQEQLEKMLSILTNQRIVDRLKVELALALVRKLMGEVTA